MRWRRVEVPAGHAMPGLGAGRSAARHRSLARLAWLTGAPLVGLLGAVVLGCLWTGVGFGDVTRDPLAVTGAPPYTGIVSNVGVLLWCTAAAVCLFCAAMRGGDRFLLCSGLLTVLLLCDDLFMLHEAVVPRLLGVSEEVVFAAYGAILLAYLVRFRDEIRRVQFTPLLASFGFFAASIVVDVSEAAARIPGSVLAEDGCKLLGIGSWFVYLVSASADRWRAAIVEREWQGYAMAHSELASLLEGAEHSLRLESSAAADRLCLSDGEMDAVTKTSHGRRSFIGRWPE